MFEKVNVPDIFCNIKKGGFPKDEKKLDERERYFKLQKNQSYEH